MLKMLGWGALALCGTAASGAVPEFQCGGMDRNGAIIRKSPGGTELAETSGGSVGNLGSDFVGRFDANSPEVKLLNTALARPEGSVPAEFGIVLKMEELERSSLLLHANFGINMHGAGLTRRGLLSSYLKLNDVAFNGVTTLDSANTPMLRFQLKPSGGKQRIDAIELVFAMRVENTATPQRLKVNDFSLVELPNQAAGLKNIASFVDTVPSGAMVKALNAAGFRYEFSDASNADAPLQFIGSRLDQAETARKISKAVAAGKTVVLNMDVPCRVLPEIEKLVPFNDWSTKEGRFRRDGAAVDFSSPVALNWAYDLHLPGAPIENSLHRYDFLKYEKPLNNSDWRIVAATRQGMPLLISGRSANGRVYVFGGNWNDGAMATSPGVDGFMHAIVRDMTALSSDVPVVSDGLTLSVSDFQPDGLFVEVKNPSEKAARGVLSYQVATWEREILNAETVEFEVAAKATKKITLRERGAFKGDAKIAELGSSIPYRRIRAAFLMEGRSKVANELRADVSIAPIVALSLSENSASWPKEAVREEIDNASDGTIGKRFVWPVGSVPEVTISVFNRLTNIAPLAVARDEKTPDNPTTPGLNDLSLSRGNVRQKGKNQGGWSGPILPAHLLSLTWNHPVVVASLGIETYGPFRFENRTSPGALELTADGTSLLKVDPLQFTANGSELYSRFYGAFSPKTARRIELGMSKMNSLTLGHLDNGPTNCAMKELEIYGWPVEENVKFEGTLEVSATDLVSGKTSVLLNEKILLPAYSRKDITLKFPTGDSFGPVRYDVIVRDGAKTVASARCEALYITPGHPAVVNKKTLGEWEVGLLCTPGWYNYDSFGRGMKDWAQGWGGPHDQIWALTHGLMEIGSRSVDNPARMLTTDGRNCHYTNPWRHLPDGTLGWDLTIEKILQDMLTGRHRGQKSVWVVGSDRWNGMPVGSMFGWDTFVRFDQYLRKSTGKGLAARSRQGISQEIMTKYADLWQRWNMEEYAKIIEDTRKMFADKGIKFTFETHGSFPLAGGELGDRLGATHAGVGTDLFWELRNQDLYWSLGTRFAIVAANPNLSSGTYKQWGWINSEANQWWYSNNGPVEPSRRQWYSTYFMGRVDSTGKFLPYHVLGYGLQGGVSTKFHKHEIENSERTFNFTRQVRPEAPAGYGFIVSWDSHVRRMSAVGGTLGFGLYASGGSENQLEHRMGKLYEKLVKNGLPIGFVSSSHALQNWKGKSPLVLLDASDWQGKELETITRLHNAGASVIAFGGDDRRPEALRFWTSGATKKKAGALEYYVRRSAGKAPLIYCPLNGTQLPAGDMALLLAEFGKLCKMEISVKPQMVVNPFISHGALFLALGSIADQSGTAEIAFNPVDFNPAFAGKALRVIDLDEMNELRSEGGVYKFPAAASAGRMLMIVEKK